MRKILLVFIVLISLIGCGKDRDKILKYLGKKYKEEFVVKYEVPTRKGGTMAVVIPKRYLGTSKEKDKFYEAEVTYRDGEIRKDDYIWVKNRESIEAYVKPEVEKIFGKNVLVALDGGRYREGNFKDDLELLKKSTTDEERRKNSFQIEGGIYIFGRVESEKDREKYRRGIYEFIQYLKQEGMFEYVDINFEILDERILSKGLNENSEDIATLKGFGSRYEVEKRDEIYSKYTEDFKNTPQDYKNKVIEQVRRSKPMDDLYITSLLYTRVFSPKYLKSKGWDTTTDKRLHVDLKEYSNIKDVKFNIGVWQDKEE